MNTTTTALLLLLCRAFLACCIPHEASAIENRASSHGPSVITREATTTEIHRHLSQELFLSYEPLTTVTDHAAIDLDQAAMEQQLALGTDAGFEAALNIYTRGAFSKPYAEIALNQALTMDVGEGVTAFGRTVDGKEVRLSTAQAFSSGDTVVQLQYHSGQVQASWTDCHVGGNPSPNTEGCLAPTGTVEIGELGEFAYTYNPLDHNYNARTLQGFSTEARPKMYECATCPYRTYEKFYYYYGEFDYANHWILAAFNKGSTNLANGNADFSSYGLEGTREAIEQGTVMMSVWMYVIRQLQVAVDGCNSECNSPTDACSDDQIHAWDQAVAFYTGSVPKATGQGGHLLYTLAQKRCANFGTCILNNNSDGTDNSNFDIGGMAKVNDEIFQLFRMGQQDLFLGNCQIVESHVKRIQQLMTVPLIQGTLRYAYIIDVQRDNREKAEAEGAVHAASVLPLLYHCSKDDADILYHNMRVGNGGSGTFATVKHVLEANYICLGVTCADVGGLVDTVTGGYLVGAEPCGSPCNTTTITFEALLSFVASQQFDEPVAEDHFASYDIPATVAFVQFVQSRLEEDLGEVYGPTVTVQSAVSTTQWDETVLDTIYAITILGTIFFSGQEACLVGPSVVDFISDYLAHTTGYYSFRQFDSSEFVYWTNRATSPTTPASWDDTPFSSILAVASGWNATAHFHTATTGNSTTTMTENTTATTESNQNGIEPQPSTNKKDGN